MVSLASRMHTRRRSLNTESARQRVRNGAASLSEALTAVADSDGICVISITALSQWHHAAEQEVVFQIPKDTSDEQWCYLSKSLTWALMNVLDMPGAGEMLMGSITSAIYLSDRTDVALDYLESYRAGHWEPDY